MILDRWIRKLLPHEDKFLALFEQDAANLVVASAALRGVLEAPTAEERLRRVKEVESLEHRGDDVTHAIFRELGKTFITPLDREDIAGLAITLDDILDNIDRAATCINLYGITEFEPPVRELAAIIEKQVTELNHAIPLLRDLRQARAMLDSCVRVNELENEADDIFHAALGRIFQEEKDPIALIKRRELLAMLESATDRCETAAVMVENVLVKYA